MDEFQKHSLQLQELVLFNLFLRFVATCTYASIKSLESTNNLFCVCNYANLTRECKFQPCTNLLDRLNGKFTFCTVPQLYQVSVACSGRMLHSQKTGEKSKFFSISTCCAHAEVGSQHRCRSFTNYPQERRNR